MNAKHNHKGFTLIELLVVIAIIALLMSIIMPALGRAKMLAQRAACASNLKSSVLSCILYSQDHREYPHLMDFNPCLFKVVVSPSEVRDFSIMLKPYIGNFEAWRCGALGMAATIDDPRNTRSMCYDTFFYFPGLTWPTFNKQNITDTKNGPQPVKPEAAKVAGGRVMMQDVYYYRRPNLWAECNHAMGPAIFGVSNGTNPSYVVRQLSNADPTRGDGANLGFYDGHVQWYIFENLDDVGPYHPNFLHEISVYSKFPQ